MFIVFTICRVFFVNSEEAVHAITIVEAVDIYLNALILSSDELISFKLKVNFCGIAI